MADATQLRYHTLGSMTGPKKKIGYTRHSYKSCLSLERGQQGSRAEVAQASPEKFHLRRGSFTSSTL